jgi:hypothetical protein
MDTFCQRHWDCRSELSPTSEEMNTYFTWYHVLLLRPESALGMLNHLIWFLESAVDEDQDEQCHYSPGSSFLIQCIITLQEQTTVVVDARWGQSKEHCRAFRHRDAAASRLGSTFLSLDHNGPCDVRRQPGPQILCADMANDNDVKCSERHDIVRGVNIDLMNHSRWAGDTVPSVLKNFSAHPIDPKLGRGNTSNITDCQASRKEPCQGGTWAGLALDRNGGESTHTCTRPLFQRPAVQVVLSPSNLCRLRSKPSIEVGLAPTPRFPNQTGP